MPGNGAVNEGKLPPIDQGTWLTHYPKESQTWTVTVGGGVSGPYQSRHVAADRPDAGIRREPSPGITRFFDDFNLTSCLLPATDVRGRN